jgi:hypothetical protein
MNTDRHSTARMAQRLRSLDADAAPEPERRLTTGDLGGVGVGEGAVRDGMAVSSWTGPAWG